MKKFLQAVDASFFLKNIDTTISISGVDRKELELLWSPVIEGKNAKQPFIQMKPEDILDNKLNNKIDTMFGFTSAVSNFNNNFSVFSVWVGRIKLIITKINDFSFSILFLGIFVSYW